MYFRAALHSSRIIPPRWLFPRLSHTPKDWHPSPLKSQPRLRSAIIHSSSGSAVAIVATSVTLLTGALAFYRYIDPISKSEVKTALEKSKPKEESAMTIGTSLPGRPGNLTAEQEEKLKELWSAILQIFGVLELAKGDNTSTEGSESQRPRASTLGSEKKKKRRNLFRGKQEDELSNGADSLIRMDGEDKYGQAKEFHKLLETQPPEELRRVFWSMVKHDNPDSLLLRFLRARKWHVQNALVMLVATMNWRLTEAKVDDDIVRRGEGGAAEDSASSNPALQREGHDFLQQMRMGKSFLHGTDKEGRPMCFVRARLHKQGEQTEASLERYTVYTIETARLLLHDNIDTAVSFYDCDLRELCSDA